MRKILSLGLASVFALLGIAVWVLLIANYSEGFRVGQVIKLSHKGVVFKTWEGTLDQGYLAPQADTGIATRIWDFSVDEGGTGVRQAIDGAIAHNQRVKLYYREKYFQWSFRGDTKYFVYKLEVVNPGEPKPPAPPPPPQVFGAPNTTLPRGDLPPTQAMPGPTPMAPAVAPAVPAAPVAPPASKP